MNQGGYQPESLEDQVRRMVLTGHGAQPRHGQQQSGGVHGHAAHRDQYSARPGNMHQSLNRGPPQYPQRTRPVHSANIDSERRPGFNDFVAQRASAPQVVHHATQPRYDPNAFHRGPPQSQYGPPRTPNRQLYEGHNHRQPPVHQHGGHAFDAQAQYLQQVAEQEIAKIEMTAAELDEKDLFRINLEMICKDLTGSDRSSTTSASLSPPLPAISLQKFGSLASGFATQGSDMDLVIVVAGSFDLSAPYLSMRETGLPRMLEKELLDRGYGARLLSRTRVPIVKICEKPTPQLLEALRNERDRWDALPDEEKLANAKPSVQPGGSDPKASQTDGDVALQADSSSQVPVVQCAGGPAEPNGLSVDTNAPASSPSAQAQAAKPRNNKAFTREKAKGPLDFPKDGVGIQCDINFFNPLGLHNTQMLRCYSLCDPRVRPMVLFIKAWAKQRKINHPYSGTLSSYGYVLMVLHYLVNIVKPPVLPNLQVQGEKAGPSEATVDGWNVKFWSDQGQISAAAGTLTHNRESLGALIRGFFQYYAVQGGFGFVWTQDVLSLRSVGGLLSKASKGWTGAKTETTDTKEVRHRYLFAIEDPFELTHNVARTVTHPGICAIRDEFRRAWRILAAIGRGLPPNDGHLFAELIEGQPSEPPGQQQSHQPTQRLSHPPVQQGSQQPVQQYAQRPMQNGRPNANADALFDKALAQAERKKMKKKGPQEGASG